MRGLTRAIAALLLFVSASSAAGATSRTAEGNVILLMLDGVRWQEVFLGVDPNLSDGRDSGPTMPFLWRELMRYGVIFGNREKGSDMTTSNNKQMSLPGYQAIMAGFTQPCGSNDCDRIGVETVQERVVRELGLERREVATIASWEKIPLAVEKREGATFVNAGFRPLDDGTRDERLDRINAAQVTDVPPWEAARWDRYTWAHSMLYLEKHRPRFMFISLNDSDEWAHRGDYPRYIEAIRQYDSWIRDLAHRLGAMGEYGRKTTLIITTDHGRGSGAFGWQHHASYIPGSKYVWLYGVGPRTDRQRSFDFDRYTHNDIRPTMEAALGLRPQSCDRCGKVIREIVARPNRSLTRP